MNYRIAPLGWGAVHKGQSKESPSYVKLIKCGGTTEKQFSVVPVFQEGLLRDIKGN